MSNSSPKVDVGSLLQQLRDAGVVIGEGLAFDNHGIVLELRIRATATEIDPAAFQFYFPFVVDKLMATLSENADLKEAALGSEVDSFAAVPANGVLGESLDSRAGTRRKPHPPTNLNGKVSGLGW